MQKTSVLVREADAVSELEIISSAERLDPDDWPGWRVVELDVGWLAVRLVV